MSVGKSESGEGRAPGEAGKRRDDGVVVGKRRARAQAGGQRDEQIEGDRAGARGERPAGMAERRSRHDRERHRTDGTDGERVKGSALRDPAGEAVQAEEEQPQREPLVFVLHMGYAWLARGRKPFPPGKPEGSSRAPQAVSYTHLRAH